MAGVRIGTSFGVMTRPSLRAHRSTLSHRTSSRVFRRVSTNSPAAGRSVHAIEVIDAPTHCVVESGGDESTLYYQYSFSDASPGSLARPDFESDGVKLYISKSATKAKSAEVDLSAAAVEPVVEDQKPGKADVKSRVVDAVSAAVRVVEEIAHKQEIETSEVVEDVEEVKVPQAAEVPESPPLTFPANKTLLLRHCVFEESEGGATTYHFTEDPPSNVGKAAFETAGIKAYVNRGGRVPAVETETTAAPEPALATPESVAARVAVSSPGKGTGGVASGKSGVVVYERGVGIAAWQGLEIGYEVDVVLEVPAGKEEAAPALDAPAAPAVPASSVEKRVWLAKPVVSAPRGERQTRSGASVFADGVGFVTFRNAVTQVDGVAAAAPEKTVALKDARSVGSGGVVFSGAGSGSASWQRSAAAVDPPVSESALAAKEDFATVAVWAACALLLAFKLLIVPT